MRLRLDILDKHHSVLYIAVSVHEKARQHGCAHKTLVLHHLRRWPVNYYGNWNC